MLLGAKIDVPVPLSHSSAMLHRMCMKSTHLAWAAGLIDGEGCLSITKHPACHYKKAVRDRYVPLLKVTMCHKDTIERLQRLFNTGSFSHSVKMPVRSDTYTWLCNAKQAKPVLQMLLPYFVTKYDEALVLLEYLNLPPAPRGGNRGGRATPDDLMAERERIYWQLRSLKSRFQFRDRGKKPGRKPKAQTQSSSRGSR